jgi:hypothetical protein
MAHSLDGNGPNPDSCTSANRVSYSYFVGPRSNVVGRFTHKTGTRRYGECGQHGLECNLKASVHQADRPASTTTREFARTPCWDRQFVEAMLNWR